nr:hypothetical protein [Tanacetum cinerariifolium]
LSGGAKAILHSVNQVLSEYHNDGSLAMLTVDFSNAFNLMDRSTLLHEQGDPLGPLLFALILNPLLHKIKDSCKLLLHAWYLDDGTVIGDSEEVVRVPSSGMKLLGGAVSRDVDFISGLAMRRAANAVYLMGLLPQLHDPQSELLLLRSCLCGLIENIVVCGGPFFGDLQWRLSFLPIRFGGLGLYSTKLVSSYGFVASRAQSWVLQDHILRDSGICGMYDDYVSALACLRDTIPRFDVSVFECLRTPHAQDFLLAIPIDGIGLHMSPVEYRTILREHAVHCKELPGFKYRHDMVRDVLFDICRRVGISAKKEAPVNF